MRGCLCYNLMNILQHSTYSVSLSLDPDVAMRGKKAILVITVIGLSLGYIFTPTKDSTYISSRRSQFFVAMGSSRIFEARLTGHPPYGVYHSPRSLRQVPKSARRIAREIQRGASIVASPILLADSGVVDLLDGRFGKAITKLEEAHQRNPNSGTIINDLAAVYLARAEHIDEPYDYILALSLLDQAVEAGSRLPEIWYNRALALERLSLLPQARDAWRRFLEIEPVGEWLEEGAGHLEAISQSQGNANWNRIPESIETAVERKDLVRVQSIVRQFPQLARRLGEEQTLADWARAFLKGDESAAQSALQSARLVGGAVVQFNGDRLLSDAVKTISSSSYSNALLLAKGHLQYAAGRLLYARSDFGGAAVQLSYAQRTLAQGGSPFELRADYALGSCQHYLSFRGRALRRLERIVEQAESNNYLSLLGEALWMQGLAHFASHNTDSARTAYLRALAVFGQTEEQENIAGANILLGELFDRQGDARRAWKFRIKGLQSVPFILDDKRIYQIYATSAIATAKMGELRIALYFQGQALSSARKLPSPLARAQAAFWKSKYQKDLGLNIAALEGLREAKLALSEIPDNATKRRTEAEVLMMEAETMLVHRPSQAVHFLTKALNLYEEGRHQTHLVEMLTSRAKAFQVLGDTEKAEEDLESAIQLIENWRKRIASSDERVSFLSDARRLSEAMVMFQVERRHDHWKAFEYIDKDRTKTLADVLGRRGSIDWAKDGIPGSTVFISYIVIESRLFVFIVKGDGSCVGRLLARDWVTVEREIVAFRAGIEGHAPTAELERLSSSLFTALVSPLGDVIKAEDHLVISGDGVICRLPFSALRDAKTHRYLIEDHAITLAPSMAIYLKSLKQYRRLSKAWPVRILLVDNPLYAKGAYPALTELGSLGEASSVSSSYREMRLLDGRSATVKAFVHDFPEADVIHFRGHSIANWSDPADSVLLFASEGTGRAERLTAREIASLAVDRPRLVILASCSTADGRVMPGEGAESLARAFLAAGVPAVVGSAWDIEDSTSRNFMEIFHKLLSEGINPAVALRWAKIDFSRDSRPVLNGVRTWAAFEIIGGSI
jgi:CHAT domain-containing protein